MHIELVGDMWQREVHTAKPLVSEPTPFQVEIAIGNLQRYGSNAGRIYLSQK
jgi:hypothetical protein